MAFCTSYVTVCVGAELFSLQHAFGWCSRNNRLKVLIGLLASGDCICLYILTSSYIARRVKNLGYPVCPLVTPYSGIDGTTAHRFSGSLRAITPIGGGGKLGAPIFRTLFVLSLRTVR